jgi:acyl-CoA reductase-like NAD-dependent aldehyde dehydrogenase
MPAQGTEAQRIRRKTADSEASFPGADVDLLFDQAEEDYADYSRKVIFQSVVVSRLKELGAAASKRADYKLNETEEKRNQTFKALMDLIEDAEKELEELIGKEKGVALRTAVMKRIPSRIKGYPNG